MSTWYTRRGVAAILVAGASLATSGVALAQGNVQADGERTRAGTNVQNQAEIQFTELAALALDPADILAGNLPGVPAPVVLQSVDPETGGATAFVVDELVDHDVFKAPEQDTTIRREATPDGTRITQPLTITNLGNDDETYTLHLRPESGTTAPEFNFVGTQSLYADNGATPGVLDDTDQLLVYYDATTGQEVQVSSLTILLDDGDVSADVAPAFLLSGTDDVPPGAPGNVNDDGVDLTDSQTAHQVAETSVALLFVTNIVGDAASNPDPISEGGDDTSPVLPPGLNNMDYARYRVIAAADGGVGVGAGDNNPILPADATDHTHALTGADPFDAADDPDPNTDGDADDVNARLVEEVVIGDNADPESASQATIDSPATPVTDITAERDAIDGEILTFRIQAVDANFTKEVTTVCDPINGFDSDQGVTAYNIPGAYVRYKFTITVEDTSAPVLYTILNDNLPDDVSFDIIGIGSGTSANNDTGTCNETGTPFSDDGDATTRNGIGPNYPIRTVYNGATTYYAATVLGAPTPPAGPDDLPLPDAAAIVAALANGDLAGLAAGITTALPFVTVTPRASPDEPNAGQMLQFIMAASPAAGGLFNPGDELTIEFNAIIR